MRRLAGGRAVLRPAALLTALGLCACVHRPPKLVFGPRGRITDPAIALRAVRARAAPVRSVQGEAKASVHTPHDSGHVTELIAAERPEHARLDAVSMFGPLATFTTDGRRFTLADFRHHVFYQGRATPGAIAQLLPLRLPAAELVSLLLGLPPLVEGAAPVRLTVDAQRAVYVLELASPADGERIELEPETLRPVAVVLGGRPDIPGYRATFADFGGPFDLPREVKLVSADGRTMVELEWRSRKVNPRLPATLFTQPVPAGFAVQP